MRTTTTKIMISFKAKYNIGDRVFLSHDPEQYERQVVAIVYYGAFIQYMLSCGDVQSPHFEYEINTDKNILFNLN